MRSAPSPTALVLGGGGFIGNHMINRLKEEKYWVRGVDVKLPPFNKSRADEFLLGDLRNADFMRTCLRPCNISSTFSPSPFTEIYQYAADMGGAGYVFSGEHDADIMHNSVQINLNLLDALCCRPARIHASCVTFYAGSACMYPAHNQRDTAHPNCLESSAYPADPDSEYGWEKLFSERLYLAYARNYNIRVRLGRFHNIYGPLGTWDGGKEKAPAALCRKIAALPPQGGEIEVWGRGDQTRSFLYIADCIEATRRLMCSEFQGPVNIGSEEMIAIDDLASLIARIAGKRVSVRHVPGPVGVQGRNSQNDLIRKELKWDYSWSLVDGLIPLYAWIAHQRQERQSEQSEGTQRQERQERQSEQSEGSEQPEQPEGWEWQEQAPSLPDRPTKPHDASSTNRQPYDDEPS